MHTFTVLLDTGASGAHPSVHTHPRMQPRVGTKPPDLWQGKGCRPLLRPLRQDQPVAGRSHFASANRAPPITFLAFVASGKRGLGRTRFYLATNST